VAGRVDGSGTSISDCVALNPSVTGDNYVGRVTALMNGGVAGGANIAWDDMTVSDNLVNSVFHGIDKTAVELKQKATYEALGWEFGEGKPWKWGGANYPLPVLSWQEESTYPALPEHLE